MFYTKTKVALFLTDVHKLVLNTDFIIILKVDPVRTRGVRKETGNAGM